MVLTNSLRDSIGKLLLKHGLGNLKEASRALTEHYKNLGFLQDKEERIAYLAVRMPATFQAIYDVFEKIPFTVKTILDVGAGPGTVGFVAKSFWENVEITAIEKDPFFLEIAQELDAPAKFIAKDVQDLQSFETHDFVCFGYSFGEILEEKTLTKCWDAAKKGLAIIEPGTPKGYQNILKARDVLLANGGHLLAPCPHSFTCPLKDKDWCHFSARVERDFFHKYIKNATLPFEDEKYSYVIFTKENLNQPASARILRAPQKKSGHVRLFLCCPDGAAREEIISKKHKELYKQARKSEWGNTLNLQRKD